MKKQQRSSVYNKKNIFLMFCRGSFCVLRLCVRPSPSHKLDIYFLKVKQRHGNYHNMGNGAVERCKWKRTLIWSSSNPGAYSIFVVRLFVCLLSGYVICFILYLRFIAFHSPVDCPSFRNIAHHIFLFLIT